MTISDLRDGEYCLKTGGVVQDMFSPHLSLFETSAAIGQLSCRASCQAYRSVTNQPEKLQQECLSLPLCSPSPGSPKGTEVLRT